MKVLDKEVKQQLAKPLDSILDGIADHAPKSRTIAKGNGIYRITVKTNSDGMISETETRLSDLFHIIGIGQDGNGDYSYIPKKPKQSLKSKKIRYQYNPAATAFSDF